MAREGIEPPTLRFSVRMLYQLSYLAAARNIEGAQQQGRSYGFPFGPSGSGRQPGLHAFILIEVDARAVQSGLVPSRANVPLATMRLPSCFTINTGCSRITRSKIGWAFWNTSGESIISAKVRPAVGPPRSGGRP